MADEQELIDWPSETVPPTAKLHMRVHRSFVKDGDFLVGAFRDHGGAMSTEWDKYSTPSDVRGRAKVLEDNGVIEMIVAGVLEIEGLSVRHTPDVERRIRGHVDVAGTKTPEVRVKLKRIARWAIPLTIA